MARAANQLLRAPRAPQRGRGTWKGIAAFVFGAVFLAVMLTVAIGVPNPTEFQIFVFRVTLAVAAAGLGAVLPGFLVVNVPPYVRAGGAMALFVIVYWSNPPALVTGFTPFDEAMRRAEIAFGDQSYNAAATFFQKARQARPDNWKPYHGLGRVEYKRGNLTTALEYFTKAFEFEGKKDGSLVYALASLHEGLGNYEKSERTLNVAADLIPADEPMANDVVFDRGLVNLILWQKNEAPRETERYRNAELAFKTFLERGALPSHWVFYHLACLKATRAQDGALSPAAEGALRVQANEALERAVILLAEYKSVKAPLQRKMMRDLLIEPEKYSRQMGEPVACPPLVRSWTVVRGALTTLVAKLE